MSSTRSIAFWRDRQTGGSYIHVIATTKTEDPNAPIELVRPYGDGSGDEVLVSLSAAEWNELIGFVGEHSSNPREDA